MSLCPVGFLFSVSCPHYFLSLCFVLVLVRDQNSKVLDVLGEELPCVRYDGWGNLTPSGYFKFDLGALINHSV